MGCFNPRPRPGQLCTPGNGCGFINRIETKRVKRRLPDGKCNLHEYYIYVYIYIHVYHFLSGLAQESLNFVTICHQNGLPLLQFRNFWPQFPMSPMFCFSSCSSSPDSQCFAPNNSIQITNVLLQFPHVLLRFPNQFPNVLLWISNVLLQFHNGLL